MNVKRRWWGNPTLQKEKGQNDARQKTIFKISVWRDVIADYLDAIRVQ
jgi:hypothetical protein